MVADGGGRMVTVGAWCRRWNGAVSVTVDGDGRASVGRCVGRSVDGRTVTVWCGARAVVDGVDRTGVVWVTVRR